MSRFELRPYQQTIINNILHHFDEGNKRCCVSLATGGGKTVVFSELINNFTGNILIAVHREELVYQTQKTINKETSLIIPNRKKYNPALDVQIAMVQTLSNRLKKEEIKINDYNYLIIDECHRGEFMKILNQYNGNVIGFTATPNYEKTEYFFICSNCGNKSKENCCGTKPTKFKQRVPLSKYYHHLLHGIEINELIEQGYLVQDEMYSLPVDTSKLVYDPISGEYTEESISLVFGSDEAIYNTVSVYEKLALNKKTILFNGNTLVNKKLYIAMKMRGLPVKMFDSNNSNENRKELVKWFESTPNAILLNVHVFTTGFDCTDVEVVFLNKKTNSLNLFIQMVGRGGRITDKIFKPSFRVIDMGNNKEDFGNWSDKRDWNELFYKEYIQEIKGAGIPKVRQCHNCAAVIAANSLFCPECKAPKKYNQQGVIGLPKKEGKPIIPSANQIIKYCEDNKLPTTVANNIVRSFFSDMFIDVKYSTFLKHKTEGTLFRRAYNVARPYYFAIQKSNLEGNKIRTLNSFVNEIIKSIQKGYENRGQSTI